MQVIENGNLHKFEEMTPEKRPQDPRRDGAGLELETLEHDELTTPQAILLTDAEGRSATYVPREEPLEPPQDLLMNGTGLTFATGEHGGEYPDDMPQLVRLTDAQGRSCDYVPIRVGGRVVDSKGFTLLREP